MWEQRYDHGPRPGFVADRGAGPRATPLIAGDRIYTIGIGGRMHSLDKRTGEIRWSRDLWGEPFGGNVLQHGYSSSPIEYGDTVIALVGGEGAGIVAFDQRDGGVVWQNLDLANSYSSPQILTIDGQAQLVTFMARELVGGRSRDRRSAVELSGREPVRERTSRRRSSSTAATCSCRRCRSARAAWS